MKFSVISSDINTSARTGKIITDNSSFETQFLCQLEHQEQLKQ